MADMPPADGSRIIKRKRAAEYPGKHLDISGYGPDGAEINLLAHQQLLPAAAAVVHNAVS
jgi:hypothetical protein